MNLTYEKRNEKGGERGLATVSLRHYVNMVLIQHILIITLKGQASCNVVPRLLAIVNTIRYYSKPDTTFEIIKSVKNIFRDSNITFRISAPHCGLVSLTGRPAYPVSQFNMEQIRTGQVVFTHTGQRQS
jgi:hypothetical protein